ncbi:30S ribosome-binding factor RbfA [Candidatus Purcelliella pentastirinorum]|uniref:Ribosome-binding factor A n=1 Tax=Candidatus Purcelliella pentastirinorum TaxID=472834 RepID=A0AAX3N740_9ENTR|nr:30S ribosome-binding factor RbfA [Candidatus Purcelliella pentastirinorum]WDI78347.1 30S ribosome-binding factor RbfA [Candidatus Purcelliella pentastirinorum]WDR80625.1 30S ribosome-binding factor RbfA [Candidatus Purcelliella pentastirinorum]
MNKNKTRSLKIAKELKKNIANIILLKIKDPRLEKIIILSDIIMSNDLKYANIFIMFIKNENLNKKNILNILNKASGYIRILLKKKMYIKNIPILNFLYDYSLDNGIKIFKLIKKLKKTNK